MGFSDLHCNQAMTELIKRLDRRDRIRRWSSARATTPSTARRSSAAASAARRQIAGQVPFVVATGNHDSDVTETQMRSAGMTVLDGAVVTAGGVDVLGDDDPEHNIPFSVERTKDRPETEEQLGAADGRGGARPATPT